jgi:hypothetical protein
MKALTIKGFYDMMDNIKKHQVEISRLNSGLSQIMNEDVYSGLGGKLLDNYIDLITFFFSDEEDLIAWFVFENEFGAQNLQKEVNGKLISINNEEELFKQLYIQLKRIRRKPNGKG